MVNVGGCRGQVTYHSGDIDKCSWHRRLLDAQAQPDHGVGGIIVAAISLDQTVGGGEDVAGGDQGTWTEYESPI